MFGTIIRVLIVYIIVLLVIRLMGKRQIGQMQPFELVITLIIADLATIPMSERTIPLVAGIVPVITLLIAHSIIAFLIQKCNAVRKFVNGKPVIVVSPNGIEYENMRKLNMNMDDLQELLRGANCQNLSEIRYAIVETNGNFSVIKTAESSPVSVENLNLNVAQTQLNIILISDFKLMKDNIKCFNFKKDDVEKIVKEVGGNKYKIKDIFYLSFDAGGNVYMQPKGAKSIIGSYKFKGELNLWKEPYAFC